MLAVIGGMGEVKKPKTAAVGHICQLPDVVVAVVIEQADTVGENVSVDFWINVDTTSWKFYAFMEKLILTVAYIWPKALNGPSIRTRRSPRAGTTDYHYREA